LEGRFGDFGTLSTMKNKRLFKRRQKSKRSILERKFTTRRSREGKRGETAPKGPTFPKLQREFFFLFFFLFFHKRSPIAV